MDASAEHTEQGGTSDVRRKALAHLQKKDPERYHYFLWFKFILLNTLGFAAVALAFFHGWLGELLGKTPDKTWLDAAAAVDLQTRYMLILFVLWFFGWLLSFRAAFLTSREINAAKQRNPPQNSYIGEYLRNIQGRRSGGRRNIHGLLRSKCFARIRILPQIAASLVLLGLVGTVAGFIIAFGGVDPQSVSDVNKAVSMVAELIRGVSFALYTTVVGAVLGGLWIRWNYHIIAVGSETLIRLIGERGEDEANVLD